MEKALFQDVKDLGRRQQMLLDNADEVEEMDFNKSFSTDQLASLKEKLATLSIQITNLQEQLADYRADINAQLKPLKQKVSDIIGDLRAKSHLVHEKVYKFVDTEERLVTYYDKEGIFVSSRPATAKEMSPTVFSVLREKNA